MKKLLVVAALGMALSACQQADNKEEKVQATPAKSQVAAGEVKDEHQMAYAMGAQMAQYVRKDMEKYEALKMDKSQLIRGFTDALNDKALLDEQEVQSQLKIFQEKLRFAKKQESEKNTAENLAKGKQYLEENGKKPNVMTTKSGLQYEVIEQGKDATRKPKATDMVKVHYTGKFIDGEKFDSSVDRGQPAEFPLNRVIKGWTEGLQLMSVGSKYKFVIPSDLAYGPNDRGPIPGNSVLVFDVELLDIIDPQKAAEDAKK